MRMKLSKYHLLSGTVFITGAVVLIVEIVAIRILAVYYGNTIFTASSVITVILLALSCGYYAGGRLADRHPSWQLFFGIILLSGLLLLFFHLIGKILLPILSLYLSISAGPLASSFLLFLLPSFLLGTLSPFAIKLQTIYSPEQGVGATAGKIFFWSTLGSITGSLLAGFLFIPKFGLDQIIIASSTVLFLLGAFLLFILGFQKKHLLKFLLLFVMVAGAAWSVDDLAGENIVYSKDGVYEKITIYGGEYGGRPAMFLRQDRSSSAAMFLDSNNPTDLVYEYTKYYRLYKVFTPEPKSVLVIGGGAYSIPKAVLEELPLATVDVAEIEPSLFELAKKYFGLVDSPRLHNYIEDGRRLLHESDKKYDVIFSDVYYSLFSIPAHFTTQEFFALVKEKLRADGILIINIIGDLSLEPPSLLMSEIKTMLTVFQNSYFFALVSPEQIEPQNIILVGHNSDKKIDLRDPPFVNHPDAIIRSLRDRAIDIERGELSPYPVLTDNFSPVEYLATKVVKKSFDKQNKKLPR